MSIRHNTTRIFAATLATILLGLTANAAKAGDDVCPENGSGPDICVNWDAPAAPIEGSDFTVNYACTGCDVAPKLELLSGDGVWTVYSMVDETTVGAMGDITVDDPADTDDFDLKIQRAGGAGATNVGLVNLKDPDAGWTGHSNLGATDITGNLAGLTLPHDSGGVGGDITGVLTVGGDLTGEVKMGGSILAAVTISGDVKENVGIDGKVTGTVTVLGQLSANLTVGGNLTGTMIIRTFTVDNKSLTIEGDVSGTLIINGDLDSADDGLASGSSIVIEGETIAGAIVSTTGTLYGTFRVDGGGEGNIYITGVMEGTVTIGTNSSHTWTGVYTGSNPNPGGLTPSSGTFTFESLTGNGKVHIAGAVDGNIYIKGEMGPDTVLVVYIVRPEGRIVVNSARRANTNMRGTIRFLWSDFLNLVCWHQGTMEILDSQAGAGGNGGDLSGTIDHQGSAGWLSTGTLLVEGNMSGTVRVNTIMQGTMNFEGNVSGDINIVCEDVGEDDCDNDVGGWLGGLIEVDGDISGQITVADRFDDDGGGPLAIIRIRGALTSTGDILIDGICDGEIQIGEDTEQYSLIRCIGGLNADGTIVINDSRGNFDADGAIHIGGTGSSLPDIEYDGSILIKDTSGGAYGDFNGTVVVQGCHNDSDDLDFCICGDDNGTSTIRNSGCSAPEPTAFSCVSGCP